MKYLIMLLFASNAYALNCGQTTSTTNSENGSVEVMTSRPAYLKGATITIKQANGKQETVSEDEYMVVKRKHPRPFTKEVTKESSLACNTIEKGAANKNIVSLVGVDGYSAVKKDVSGDTATLKVERQVGAGIQYQRAVTNRVYLGGQVDSNRGGQLSIGYGF